MYFSYTISLLATGLLGLGVVVLLRRKADEREPKYIYGTIPYLTHIVGLLKEKTHYYVHLSDRVGLPIFTLPLPGTKMYVVCSPQLVLSVQKAAKDLVFPPIGVKFAAAISGCSKEAHEILSVNMTGEHGDAGLTPTTYKSIREAVLPGPNLDALVHPMLVKVAEACNELAPSARINLSDWLRHEVMMATLNAIWGEDHPLQDSRIESAFWEFEAGLYGIMFGIIPSITAKKAYEARKTCRDAFYEFFSNSKHEKGSTLLKERYRLCRDHGVSVHDIASFEVLHVLVTVLNTYHTAFWLIYYIFSSRCILQDLREEITPFVKSARPFPGTQRQRHSLSVADLKSGCPILVSTMQETLRHRSIGSSFRIVLRDTILEDSYLLKKGSTVIMPSLIYHSDHASWGADARDFNHKRFVKVQRTEMLAFQAFGGGHTLCPGRHFATAEVLAIAALFVMRFDMAPIDRGQWPPVRGERVKLWTQLTETEPLIDVDVGTRTCWNERDEWVFQGADLAITSRG